MNKNQTSTGRPVFLTIDQTARTLGVPRATVSAMIRRGELCTGRRRHGLTVRGAEIARLLGGAT